jgi:hypothetical protein
MSQSSYDLKKTQILEAQFIQTSPASSPVLSEPETVNGERNSPEVISVLSEDAVNEDSTKKDAGEDSCVEMVSETPTPDEMDQPCVAAPVTQRSEIVLHVQPATINVASQTDDYTTDLSSSISELSMEPGHKAMPERITSIFSDKIDVIRDKLPEEIDCEKLSFDLVRQLSPSDKLHNILGKCELTG